MTEYKIGDMFINLPSAMEEETPPCLWKIDKFSYGLEYFIILKSNYSYMITWYTNDEHLSEHFIKLTDIRIAELLYG